MKRLAFILAILSSYAYATTPVSGNLKDLTGTASGTFARFYLRGCRGNQPRVNGTALISPAADNTWYKDFLADASGVISGTIYATRDAAGTGNGEIECGAGIFTSTWYGVVIFSAGQQGPEIQYHAKNGVNLNLNTAVAITTAPVSTAPTGDTTYLRLDGGNWGASTGQQPNFTGVTTVGQSKPRIDPRDYGLSVQGYQGGVDNAQFFQAAIAAAETLGAASSGDTVPTVLCPSAIWTIGKPIIMRYNGDSFAGTEGDTTCDLYMNFHGPAIVTVPPLANYPVAPLGASLMNFPTFVTTNANGGPWLNLKDSMGAFLNGQTNFSVLYCIQATSNTSPAWISSRGYDDNDAIVNPLSLGTGNTNLPTPTVAKLLLSGGAVTVTSGTNLTSGSGFCQALSYDGATVRLYQGPITGSGASSTATLVQVGSQAGSGTIVEPARTDLIIGGGGDRTFPEGGSLVNVGDTLLGPIMFSNSTRGFTGGSVVVTPATFTQDANSLLLCTFANQYDIFTGCSTNQDTATVWLPVKNPVAGPVLNNVSIRSIHLNGKNIGAGPMFIDTAGSYVDANFGAMRRGLTLFGPQTFENKINFQQAQNAGSNGDFMLLASDCACGLSDIYGNGRALNTSVPYPVYWTSGSVNIYNLVIGPNQGVVTDFIFDGRMNGANNNTNVVVIGSGADAESANTAYKADVRMYSLGTMTWTGGNFGSGATTPGIEITGGNTYTFINPQFTTQAGTSAAVKIVSNPVAPVVFLNPNQRGGFNTPWVDTAGQSVVLNNPITNCTNVVWGFKKDGTFCPAITGFAASGSNNDITALLATPAITHPSFLTGITQGSGYKHQRFGATCTTAGTAYATCTTTYSWTSAFADASYTPVCTGVGPVNNVADLAISSFNASGVTVIVTSLNSAGAAVSFTTVDCTGTHD